METRWRKARRGRTVHAYPICGVLDVPLCGASPQGPFFNEFPAPPAGLRHARYCRRCLSALRRSACGP